MIMSGIELAVGLAIGFALIALAVRMYETLRQNLSPRDVAWLCGGALALLAAAVMGVLH